MHPADMTAILFELALILVLARVVGSLFVRVGLPNVVGEIFAGVLLGPSILGPSFSEQLFPADSRPFLAVLANIGLVLFMFIVGLELDVALIQGRGKVAGAVSVTSILLPFGLGLGLARLLAADHNDGAFWPFALFLGAAMSVTAFPVLARILTDRRMHRTETGGLALACAAADDVLAWTLLAVVIGISGGDDDGSWVVGLAIPFAVLALVVIRPQLRRLTTAYTAAGRLTPGILSVVLLGVLVFAGTTEYLHVHFIFGAFLFGAIMPRRDAAAMRYEILTRLEQLSVLLLLPVFFLVSGLNVNIRGLSTENLVQLAAILAVAIGGKFVGAYLGARLSGVPRWQAGALGVLMNTRGLTELIILNVGRELGLIGPQLFTMLVVMAVVTTMMTGPWLNRVYSPRRVARDVAEAERQALGDAAVDQILVIDDDSLAVAEAVDAAAALALAAPPTDVVLASLTAPTTRRLEVGSGLTDELIEIAAAMDRLESIRQRGAELGVTVRIISHVTGDVIGDLRELIALIQPRLLIVGSGMREVETVRGMADCPLMMVASTAGSPMSADAVSVTWLPGSDGEAAVVLAVRIAAGLGLPVHLGSDADTARSLDGVRRALSARQVTLVDDAPDQSFRVATTLDAVVDASVSAVTEAVPVDWRTVDLGSAADRLNAPGASRTP